MSAARPGRHLGAQRVPDDRGARPRWIHEPLRVGTFGSIVVDRMTDEQMAGLGAGEYFGAIVDYRRNFPDLPPITRVLQRIDDRLRLWMTDGPQEVAMMAGLARGHAGRVLVTGLGMGIVQQRLLARPEVTQVTTVELNADLPLVHEPAHWFGDPRHHLVLGDADALLPALVADGGFDGYVLDHWDSVGDHLEDKVAFLHLLDRHGQRGRRVSLWGFWWEVEQITASDDPDTAALLAEVERCGCCGVVLERPGDPPHAFSLPRGPVAHRCVACAERAAELPTAWFTQDRTP